MPVCPGTVVSKSFRDATLRIYPRLLDDRRYLRFFDLLLFQGFLDASKRPDKVLTHASILDVLGLPSNTSSRTFQSGRFIDEFNRNVLGGALIVVDHSHVQRAARTVSISRLDKGFLSVLDAELKRSASTTNAARVHFVSGEPFTPATAKNARETDRRAAATVGGVVPEAQRLIDYLNGLPSNAFTTGFRNNMATAISEAAKIQDVTVRRHQLALLRRIESQPQPFYGGSVDKNTVRIFSRNASVLQLRNELKHALTSVWTTFDLRSAQLAVIAKDWGADKLFALLSDGNRNVWTELSATLAGVSPTDAKSAVKKAVYAVAYGGGELTARRELRKELEKFLPADSVDLDPFFQHEIIHDLLLRARAVADVIRKGKTTNDCFGRVLKCKTKQQARSAMAQLSQSQEMQLLMPALDYAEAHPNDVRIMLWEHDGFTVHLRRDEKRNERTKRAIVKAVNDWCSKLGYPTGLVEK